MRKGGQDREGFVVGQKEELRQGRYKEEKQNMEGSEGGHGRENE